MQTYSIGDAGVSIFNSGDIIFRVSEAVSVPEVDRLEYSEDLDQTIRIPCQTVLISLPNLKVLVDPGNHARFLKESPEYAIRGENPPRSLLDQLSEAKVSKEEINYVVLTHAHFDHYAGVTNHEDAPTFPNARYFLGKEDLQNPEMQRALSDPNSKESKTIGVLVKRGLIELVANDLQLCPELQIISTPGETLGHKALKLRSQGKALYVVGDLFHHPLELEHLSWKSGEDPELNRTSKEDLLQHALQEDALILAAHVKLGKLEQDTSRVKFQLA